jgi:hypothetical protein
VTMRAPLVLISVRVKPSKNMQPPNAHPRRTERAQNP